MKKIVIVGLGLIGGSLALALKGFEDFQVIGVARRQATVDYALEHGVGDEATLDVTAAVRQADREACRFIRYCRSLDKKTGRDS